MNGCLEDDLLKLISQSNASIPCDPWTTREFNLLLSTLNSTCPHCYPDCEKVSFSLTHSSANFRKCDSRNLNIAPFCKLEHSANKMNRWLSTALAQYSSPLPDYLVDRFTKTFFWNFQKCRAVLCYILIDKQMLQ